MERPGLPPRIGSPRRLPTSLIEPTHRGSVRFHVAASLAEQRASTNLGNVEVSWQVTGIRQDAWANAHRVPVEEDKPAEEIGTYLAPEVWGLPEELGLPWRQEEGIRAHAERSSAASAAVKELR